MKSNALLLFIITLAVCLTQFASDIYAPSLPSISENLNTSIPLAQWSLAIYLLGVAISQLIYGPLSDAIGRKIPLFIGLLIFFLGTLVSLFAQNIDSLIWGRLIQGCGAGACAALWRSIFRDIFTGADLAKYGSYLVIIIMFIVPAAPTLGGFLQEAFNWRASFVFMSVYALLSLVLVLFGLKETSQHHHIDKIKPHVILKTYFLLLKSPIFMGSILCIFFSYGAFFAWFVTGPILLIKELGIHPSTFGLITFFGGGAAYGLAGWLNGRFVKRLGMPTLMRFGWSVMILSGLLMLAGYLSFGLNLLAIVIPIILFYFGSTFIWPNAFAISFTPFGHIAGFAAALYGAMQTGGGAALGALMSSLPSASPLPLSLLIISASLLSWLIYELMVRDKN